MDAKIRAPPVIGRRRAACGAVIFAKGVQGLTANVQLANVQSRKERHKLRASANRLTTFCTWQLSERFDGLPVVARHKR